MNRKLIAGLGGAIALNMLHEYLRKNYAGAPHVNEVGEQALSQGLAKAGIVLTNHQARYRATLAADVASNGLYYALTATHLPLLSGTLAGVGAVYLPSRMGLDDRPVASTDQKKLMTVGYYLFGAVVTRLIYKTIR